MAVEKIKRNLQARATEPITLKDEFVRCCLFSSVRGVSRILRSRNLFWRLVWLFSVMGLLLGATICIYFLAIQFLQYRTIQNSKRSLHKEIPFPAVTVCNLRPFSSHKFLEMASSNPKFREVMSRVTHAMKTHSNLVGDSGKSGLFFESLGLEMAHRLGHLQDDFVVSNTCLYHVQESRLQASIRYVPCQRAVLIQHNKFFNCYSFEQSTDKSNLTLSFEMVLNLNTETPLDCHDDCDSDERKFLRNDWDDSSIGARVLIHTPGTYPRIGELGIDILPGSKSTIEFRVAEVNSLSTRIKTCVPIFSKVEIYDHDYQNNFSMKPDRSYIHSPDLCRNLNMQTMLVERCGCIDGRTPCLSHQRNMPFCFSLVENVGGHSNESETNAPNSQHKKLVQKGDWWHKFEETAKCALQVMREIKESSLHCKNSCWWLNYDYKVYQSKWPSKHKEVEFYKTYIKENRQFGHKFIEYEQIIELADRNISVAQQKLLETQIISENFLRLKVFRPDFSAVSQFESLVMTPAQLVSQIGGMLSLWCGLSIITLVEFLELIFYLARCHFICRRRHPSLPAEAEVEEEAMAVITNKS